MNMIHAIKCCCIILAPFIYMCKNMQRGDRWVYVFTGHKTIHMRFRNWDCNNISFVNKPQAITLTHWGIYALVNYVSIDNGLSPVRHQAIIWTSVDLLSIRPSSTNLSENWIEMQWLSLKNASENIVCKIAIIWSRPQCVDQLMTGNSSRRN